MKFKMFHRFRAFMDLPYKCIEKKRKITERTVVLGELNSNTHRNASMHIAGTYCDSYLTANVCTVGKLAAWGKST